MLVYKNNDHLNNDISRLTKEFRAELSIAYAWKEKSKYFEDAARIASMIMILDNFSEAFEHA